MLGTGSRVETLLGAKDTSYTPVTWRNFSTAYDMQVLTASVDSTGFHGLTRRDINGLALMGLIRPMFALASNLMILYGLRGK